MSWDDDDYNEECWHEDWEADINGRAVCCQCGERWWLTAEEIRREREWVAAYDEMMRKEEWRQWWDGWINRLAFWRRWRKPVTTNDDLPF